MNEPVPFDSPAVERGLGFFETILLVGRRAVLLREHAARLLGSLESLGLPSPGPDRLRSVASEAVEAAGATAATAATAGASPPGEGAPGTREAALRLAWIAVGSDVDAPSSWRLDASVRPIPASTLARRRGSRGVSLPSGLRRDGPGLKTTSYASAVLGLRHARREGGDEGLFRDPDGRYLEGTSTALVAWCGGALAGLAPGALPSVTAAAFLRGRGVRRAPTAGELRAGAALLGSLTTAVPLLSLDGAPCGAPEALLSELREFDDRLLRDPALGELL